MSNINTRGRPQRAAPARTDPLPVQGRLSRPVVLIAGFVTAVLSDVVGWLTFSPTYGITEMWPAAMAMFVTLAAYWNHRGIPSDRRFWLTAAGLVVLFVAVGLPFGEGLVPLVWMGLGTLVQALVFGVVYRRRLASPTWAPQSSADVGWLLTSALLAALVGGLIGAFPGSWTMGYSMLPGLWWWSIRSGTYLFIGTLVTIWLRFWDPPAKRLRPSARLVRGLLAPAMLVSCYLSFAYASEPMTWLPLVPALHAGLILSPWGATIYGVSSAVAAAVVGIVVLPDAFGYNSAVASSLIVDVQVTFGVFLAILLAMFRKERDALTAEVDRQREHAQTQADMYDGMLQGMADAVLLISPDGRITWHNAAARAIAGRPILGDAVAPWAPYFRSPAVIPADDGDDAAGRDPVDEDSPQDVVAYLLHQRPGTPIRSAEMRLPGDVVGADRVLSVRSRHLRTPEGDRVLILAQDITAEHARAEQLKGFAGRVAHDLRGPLTGLSAWMEAAQGALQDGDGDAGLMAVTRGRAAIGRLATMIDDWLAYTVTREGVLRPVDLRLHDLVREVTELYDERARPSQPASFEVHVSHRVLADRSLLKVLLANLIGNAVKYCRPGEPPRVRVTSRDAAEPGWIELEVADRGIGIQAGDEERIFEEYARSERDAQAYQGSGLGLALCRAIVTRHGGWITERTNSAGGATFTLTLPASRRRSMPRPRGLRHVT